MSSFCGAPLAGVLSEAFGYSLHGSSGQQNVAALRSALLGVSMVPWALCACAWIPMRLDSEPHSESCVRFFTYPKDAGARIFRGLRSPLCEMSLTFEGRTAAPKGVFDA